MAINGTMFRQYKFGFDVWGLIVFVVVMIPTFIWAALPAVVFVSGFAICHLIFAVVNFIR